MTDTAPRISYVTLGVRDVEAATTFYADVLAFQLIKRLADASFFAMGDLRFALYQRDRLVADAGVDFSPRHDSPPGALTLSINVASATHVDAMLAAVERGGGRITRPAHTTAWEVYAGFFTDPEGFLWEVVWNPKRPGP